eukprot:TRINITY_DN7258_c0_g1_i1.p3 TRINITY_DN7258_c0_g1~~TRINITY_DN7258_c0_g1_i1.p3  ORF type:complete len:132 (-),score=1.52 TRINITY_DN7258_c0_g1_i1:223-618(-)
MSANLGSWGPLRSSQVGCEGAQRTVTGSLDVAVFDDQCRPQAASNEAHTVSSVFLSNLVSASKGHTHTHVYTHRVQLQPPLGKARKHTHTQFTMSQPGDPPWDEGSPQVGQNAAPPRAFDGSRMPRVRHTT